MREMKDSGMPWIGKIPNTWDLTKIKFVCKARNEKGYYQKDKDKYLGLENVVGFSNTIIETESSYENGIYDIYKAGDVLFNKLRPYLGKVIISSDNGFCTGEFIRLYDFQGDIRFLRYWMIDQSFIDEVDNSTYGAKMPRANSNFILNLAIPRISYNEQNKIANYLDAKCADIDALQQDLQSEIEALKEYKKSVITEAVTKGLDPDVEMKDSGIPWIGEIPKEWVICKVKNVVSHIGSGTTPTSGKIEFYENGTVNWIQSGDLYETNKINETNKKVSESAIKLFPALHIYKAKFIVIAMYGASVGNIAISNIDACVNQACCCIKTNEFNNLKYMFYWLFSCKNDFLKITDGGGQPNISQTKIKNQYYLKPPIEEQHRIVDFLDTKCARIDSIVEDKQKQISTLDEYKKSLIYEYVTGKKEVPSA
ncbi:restriction endonuclease subunit S [Acidaminococcus fermentans]|uniref:restriction endonuclease subunit S n=1 Tax=Acidaminococcus fermentans TaxID=905 RepID=UPI003F8B7DB8